MITFIHIPQGTFQFFIIILNNSGKLFLHFSCGKIKKEGKEQKIRKKSKKARVGRGRDTKGKEDARKVAEQKELNIWKKNRKNAHGGIIRSVMVGRHSSSLAHRPRYRNGQWWKGHIAEKSNPAMRWDNVQEKELEAWHDGWLMEMVAIEWKLCFSCHSYNPWVQRAPHRRPQLWADGSISESPCGYNLQASEVSRAIQVHQSSHRPDLLASWTGPWRQQRQINGIGGPNNFSSEKAMLRWRGKAGGLKVNILNLPIHCVLGL